jgi:hypothetical protein
VSVKQGYINLERMFLRADGYDMREGLLAYQRYNAVMVKLSQKYEAELPAVIAAFCALSPNNDYEGNLRSVVTLLHGWRSDWRLDEVQVSTYRHCLLRAWSYVAGERSFLDDAKGLKIRAFYHNVLHPEDPYHVTIDGHMVAIYRGENLTMKEALCKGASEYTTIANLCKALAFKHFVRPNQFQAVCWFVRKRVFNIKVGTATQYDLLSPDDDDIWRTFRDIEHVKPFPKRVQARGDDDESSLRREADQLGQQRLARLWDHWSDPVPRAEW